MTDDLHNAPPHYGGDRLAERILQAAAKAGIETITPEALAPADEFHTRGIEATRELATLVQLKPSDRVLDVGSGLGGPARVIASEFGCTVVGVDITPEFVRSAEVLTERCGLSDRVSFRLGDALDLPFVENEFDVVWTQHAVMNIQQRGTLYWDIHRVLRSGGRFAFYDILRKGEGQLPFPLPWAPDPSFSFLLDSEETRSELQNAGFIERTWRDRTEDVKQWLAQVLSPEAGNSPLHLRIAAGEQFRERFENLVPATNEGLVCYIEATFVKPETLAS